MRSLAAIILFLSCLGIVYSLLGKKNEADEVLDELSELSKQKCISSFYVAEIYAGIDQKNKAFEWLEKAYDEHASPLIFLKADPRLDSLRSDPKFLDLLQRMRLP